MRDRNIAVAIIPARYQATRFPGKLLQPLHGRSILHHVHDRALRIRGLNQVLVAADDPRILRETESFGGRCVLTSGDHQSGTDRIGEVVRGMSPPPDFVINLQGDEPLLVPRAVERLLEAMRERPDAVWTLADRLVDPDEWRRTSVVKVARARDGRALYFSREPIPHRRSEAGAAPLRHVGVYGYPRPLLEAFLAEPPSPLELAEGLEQLRALEMGLTIRVLEAAWPGAGVDTPEDLERIRLRYPRPEDLEGAGFEE